MLYSPMKWPVFVNSTISLGWAVASIYGSKATTRRNLRDDASRRDGTRGVGGGAKDHEIMHWASHFRRCGRRERIAATLIKHIFWGAAITLMTDDNEPTLSG
jgi:hypothetical protein